MRLKQIHGAQGLLLIFLLFCSFVTIIFQLFSVENLLATGEGGQTFEPAKFKLLLHHRKLELQASGQVLMKMMIMSMIMEMMMRMVMMMMM